MSFLNGKEIKTTWFDQFVFDLNDEALDRLTDAINRRRKKDAEPVCSELGMFAGQDPLDGCLQKVERAKAVENYCKRTGATTEEARQAFAQFFADNKTRIPEAALKRLAKSAKYLKKAIYG